MNNRKGLTLIELILVIAIGSIAIAVVYNILFVGLRGHSKTLKSFEDQSEIRYAIETTNNSIRFATVGFIVTKDDFCPQIQNGEVKGLVKPWNYIGLSPDKKSIVHYKYVSGGDKGSYKMEVLANGSEGVKYDLKFSKSKETQEDKIIRYILKFNNNGKSDGISTEVEALNALHVIDWGDANNPGIALAYRTDDTPEIHRKTIPAIAMVLDTSGSMNWGMDGKDTKINDDNPVRLKLLINTLNDDQQGLFTILKDSGAYISLVPFSTTANIPNSNYSNLRGIDVSKFYNANKDKNTLKKMVESLNAEGATNTGDGLRRGYYQLKKFNSNKGDYKLSHSQEVKNYMIVLVDGVTTAGSANIIVTKKSHNGVWYGKDPCFIVDDGNIGDAFYTTNENLSDNRLVGLKDYEYEEFKYDLNPISRPIGDGVNLDTNYGEPYVALIGEMIQKSKNPEIDQCFVIGYSNARNKKGEYYELKSLTNIARSLGIKVGDNEANEQFKDNQFVFVATDKESLKKAFENIGGYINEELWQVEGPRLKN